LKDPLYELLLWRLVNAPMDGSALEPVHSQAILSSELAIRQYAWRSEILADAYLGSAPTMLSNGERLLLHWLARDYPLQCGVIVDAGCFLGGSTLAFATGLALRKNIRNTDKIHSYDIFLAPNDNYSLGLIGARRPGESVLDIFVDHLRGYERFLVVHSGDILLAPPPAASIDILFIDIAKTNKINSYLLRNFFSRLVPGGLVIQQDFNDHSCPWVNASMGYLANYFDALADDGSSRVYIYRGGLTSEVLEAAAVLTLQEQYKLMQDSAVSMTVFPAYFTRISAAWVLFSLEGLDGALAYLDRLDNEHPQPWQSTEKYSDLVRRSMRYLQDISGLNNYQQSYFDDFSV